MKIEEIHLSEEHWRKQIIDLYIECFNAPDKGENWTTDSAEIYFEERLEEGSVFYALCEDGQICSLVMGGPYEKSFLINEIDLKINNSFYISLIAVNPLFRKKGLSNQLLNVVEEKIKREYKSFVVRCRSENMPVRGLFKKNGFLIESEYSSELGGVLCNRLVLTKKIHD